MKATHSRLLQVVIAAMLVNVAPDGHASTEIYDLDRVRATIPDDEPDFRDHYDVYESWTNTSDPADRGDSSGGGTDDNQTAEVDEEKKAQCDAIAAKVPASCDLENPPKLVENGCGREGDPIPDFLIMKGIPVPDFGLVFRGACNTHDSCYSTYPADKEACDLSLYTNMVNAAKNEMNKFQWTFYGPHVQMQAMAFSRSFQAPIVAPASQGAFDGAQLEGKCRFYSNKAKKAGCFD